MSFQTGLSGLNASSKNLDIIGNNIANANTIGMKSSRAEFSDLVASSLGAGSGHQGGIGVAVSNIAQQFSQGNITLTGNSLDVAINGSGFFQQTMPDGSIAYTRAGDFKLDANGVLKTNSGGKLMGYPTDSVGLRTSSSLGPLVLPTGSPIAAKATTSVTAEFNLPAAAPLAAGAAAIPGPPPVPAVPATPRSTYGTSLTAYDSQGNAVPVTMYFEKTADNTWDVFPGLDSVGPPPVTVASIGTITFDNNGKLLTNTATTATLTSPNAAIGTFTATLGFGTATQYGTGFSVSNLTQDGYTSGELTKVNIGDSGAITATYSNGQTQIAGQIALMNFRNVQGLVPSGGNSWTASFLVPPRGSAPQELSRRSHESTRTTAGRVASACVHAASGT